MKERLRHYLALIRIRRLGPIGIQRLEQHFDSLADCFELPMQTLINEGVPRNIAQQLQQPDWAAVDTDLRWAELDNHHIYCWHDPEYPAQLRKSAQPPL